ncbi:MAG: type transport system permease protein [Streptosporangiaceae bacterium]|jgi:ABC-2 type transport system permease protein|nr:type transport system permease protein [Streptosporangiaceae bacterium]
MLTTAEAIPAAAPRSALRRLTLTEAKLFVRERAGIIWGIGFPLILLVIFGNIPSFRQPSKDLGGLTYLEAYVPILIAFVIAILSISAMPAILAGYRERGVLRRMATTPVGPSRVLAAQLIMNLVLAVGTLILILGVAWLAFGVRLPRQPGGFAIAAVFTLAALLALGLFVAAVAPSGRGANAIGALLFFPMMFFAGLWLPRAAMPPALRDISDFTPLGAAVQALQDSAQGHWPHPLDLAVMACYALVFGVAAARLFRWE